jgi:hypothetical protein
MGRDWVAEKHPRMSIRWLKRFGLLNGNDLAPIGVRIGEQKFFLYTEHRSSLLSIFFMVGDQSFVQKIIVRSVNVKFGQKKLFLCPVTGRLVAELHFLQGFFASRRAFRGGLGVKNGSPETRRQALAWRKADRLMGRDGKGPARGKKRDERNCETRKTPQDRCTIFVSRRGQARAVGNGGGP